MEGRHAPPRADHPFPNNPDLTKFWGTPLPKAFFKGVSCILMVLGCYSGLNLYLTRHQKGPFGIDVTMTKEQLDKRLKILEVRKNIFDAGLPIDSKAKPSLSVEMLFDDGVSFNAPTELVEE